MAKNKYNIASITLSESNAIKLEIISRSLDVTRSKLINDILDKELIIDSILAQKLIDDIQAEIKKQQLKLLK